MSRKNIQPIAEHHTPRFKISFLTQKQINTRLFLYVGIASFSSLITDLSHYTCSHNTWADINPIRWVVVVLNFVVQGMIAWRAFLDTSADDTKPVKRTRKKKHPTS
jgi:hypothetical protein